VLFLFSKIHIKQPGSIVVAAFAPAERTVKNGINYIKKFKI
jgi:hypothetical protein